MKLGAHLPYKKLDSLAKTTEAEVAQVWLSSKQSWHDGIVAITPKHTPFYVHVPYVVNVSSSKEEIRRSSLACIKWYRELAASAGALGATVHAGNWKGHTLHAAVDQWVDIDFNYQMPLLIENQASHRRSVAASLENWELLWSKLAGCADIGVTLDTCHIFASTLLGTDIVKWAEKLLEIVGRIQVVHANGAAYQQGSGIDAHAPFEESHLHPAIVADIINTVQPDAAIVESRFPAEDISILRSYL